MFLELGLGVAVAALISLIACRALIEAGLVDAPNAARKVHAHPTPTSGGLGIALGFCCGLIAVAMASTPEWRAAVSAFGLARLSLATAFACGFMALGFVDDARPLGPVSKFGAFALLSAGAALSVGIVDRIPIGGGQALVFGPIIGLIGSALFVFTLVNCVNFMDGVNGLAMGSVAIGLLALALVGLGAGAPGVASMALCGAASLFAFLVWNFPHGRLFAGDCGALFAGALAALTSLLAVHKAALSPLAAPVIFFPLLADVLLTLAWRVAQRRRLLAGHAEHLYQIAFRAGIPRPRVTLIYWALMAFCGALAIFAQRQPAAGAGWTPLLVLVGLAIASILISAYVRRAAASRGLRSEA